MIFNDLVSGEGLLYGARGHPGGKGSIVGEKQEKNLFRSVSVSSSNRGGVRYCNFEHERG